MSYSVSNIDSLRYLYCDASRETNENWQAFNDQLVVDFNGTVEEALKTKCGFYLNRIVDDIIKLFNINHWQKSKVTEGRNIFLDLSRRKGDQLAPAIRSVVLDLTHGFRYEILRLSEQGCKDLADKHFTVIKERLRAGGKLDVTIKQALNPNPLQEINLRIDAYIKERKERYVKSQNKCREVFLCTIKNELNSSKANLNALIDRISQQVFFKDDWIDWFMGVESKGTTLSQKNKSLSNRNPFIQGLEIYQVSYKTINNNLRWTFNNPFFTAFSHTSLQQTLEEVLLLLMRLHITQTLNSKSIKDRSMTIINELCNNNDSFNKIQRQSTQIYEQFQQGIKAAAERREREKAEEMERRENYIFVGFEGGC